MKKARHCGTESSSADPQTPVNKEMLKQVQHDGSPHASHFTLHVKSTNKQINK